MQMMRCVQAVWLGEEFIQPGTLLPVGHPNAVAPFFAPIDVGGSDEQQQTGRKTRS